MSLLSDEDLEPVIQLFDDTKYTQQNLPHLAIKPSHYDLLIRFDKLYVGYTGSVKIRWKRFDRDSRKLIYISCRQVTITNGYVQHWPLGAPEGGRENPLVRVIYCKSSEVAILEFARGIPLDGLLFLNFSSLYDENQRGLYRGYMTLSGQQTSYWATNFKPNHARRCFPCFDEPRYKATFSLTVMFSQRYIIINNLRYERMAISTGKVMSNRRMRADRSMWRITFLRTPLISPYMLSLAVGPFQYVEKRTDTVPRRIVRIHAAHGKVMDGFFALDFVTKAYEWFQRYLKLEFPCEVIDVVALPDTQILTSETFAAIHCREDLALTSYDKSGCAQGRQRIAEAMAHAIAHQWFGNIVTPRWYTEIWMSEGFANYLKYICLADLYPEWLIWEHYLIDCQFRALEYDMSRWTCTVRELNDQSKEMEPFYNPCTIHKASVLVRWIHLIVAREDFQTCCNEYLRAFAYGTVDLTDIWEHFRLERCNVADKMFTTMLHRPVYPVVTVDEFVQVENNDLQMTVSQAYFSSDGIETERERGLFTYFVPLFCCTSLRPNQPELLGYLELKSGQLNYQNIGSGYIQFNPESFSYIRVKYTQEMIDRLEIGIRQQTLSAANRIIVLDDIFALVLSGQTNVRVLIKLMHIFKHDDSYSCWREIDRIVDKLDCLFRVNDSAYEIFCAWIRSLYSAKYLKLGWAVRPLESHSDTCLRGLIINRMAIVREPSLIDEAYKRFIVESEGLHSKAIQPDLRPAIYKMIAISGNLDCVDRLMHTYKRCKSYEGQRAVLSAMGYAPRHLICRCFELFNEEKIKELDVLPYIEAFGKTQPLAAWKWFQRNFATLINVFENGPFFINTVKYITYNMWAEPGIVVGFLQKSARWTQLWRQFVRSEEQIGQNRRFINESMYEAVETMREIILLDPPPLIRPDHFPPDEIPLPARIDQEYLQKFF